MQSIFFFFFTPQIHPFFFMLVYVKKKKREHATYDIRTINRSHQPCVDAVHFKQGNIAIWHETLMEQGIGSVHNKMA